MVFTMDDKKTNELMAKCGSMKDDPALMKEVKSCWILWLKKILKSKMTLITLILAWHKIFQKEDVKKVLEMALKIAKSGEDRLFKH